jgi:WD40 repeat protein
LKRILAAALIAASGALAHGLAAPQAAKAATFTPPGLTWRTITTAHFRVHFPEELREIARKAAKYAEEGHQYLGPYFGREDDVTDMTILDTEDTTNGFATPFPETSLTFFVTPPSPEEEWFLGRYDNWLKMVVVHEYTHVLHLRSAAGPGGIPGHINSAFIRAFLPEFSPLVNLDFLPDFTKEGLAVYWESALTGGGRAVEGQFDMVLRTQFTTGEPFGIDQASGKYALDWAPGGVNYSYGTLFFKYLAAAYGPKAAANFTSDLGQFPWAGINVAMSRSTGRSMYDVWDETVAYFKDRYERQVNEIKKTPLTQSQSVTTDGRIHRHPRWLSNSRLLYTRSPLEGAAGLIATDLDGGNFEFVMPKSSRKDYSLTSDNSALYYYAGGDGPPLTSFWDIYRYDLKTKGTKQVTHGQRAFCPAISPDGEKLFGVLNGGGRNDLGMLDKFGKLLWRFRGPDFGGFSNPVWSPDGKWVALSQWTDGRTNIMLFDPVAKTLRAVAPEDSVQLFPAWSPDGKHVMFSSDRTGVTNLYAVRLADGKMFRLTNVIGGAFDASVSPDMTRLAFAEYESGGYNIKVIPYKPETWAEAPRAGDLAAVPDILGSRIPKIEPAAYAPGADARQAARTGSPGASLAASLDERTAKAPATPPEAYPVLLKSATGSSIAEDVGSVDAAPEESYNPLPSLFPQELWPRVVFDLDNANAIGSNLPPISGLAGRLRGAGPIFVVQGYSQDVLRQHTYFFSAGGYFGISRFIGGFNYTNDQLPPSLSIGAQISPEVLGELPTTTSTKLLLGREERSVFAGISYPPVTSPLIGGNWLGGTVANLNFRLRQYMPFIAGARAQEFDDWIPVNPELGLYLPRQVNTVGLQFYGNDTDRPFRPFSPVGGPLWTVGVERSDKLLGSDLGYWKAWGETRYFLKGGWRNVLAMRGLIGLNFTDPQVLTTTATPRIFVNNLPPFDRNFHALGEELSTLASGSPPVGIGRAGGVAIHSLADLRTIGQVDATIPMRGYSLAGGPGLLGLHAALMSFEYRMPIWEIERGLGTIPIFFDRVSVAPFVDVGKSWVVWDTVPLLMSVGGEARVHSVLAQGIPSEFRLGFARGLGPNGVNQVILGIGSVF